MSTYTPIEEFKKKVEILSRAIENKILSNNGCITQFVFVDVCTVKGGDCVPWKIPKVKGVTLSNKLPEIYHNVGTPMYINCIGVKVVVHVEDIVYENNPVNLPWKSYTFDRYEDYLKLLSDAYLENHPDNKDSVSVWTTIKETNSSLADILYAHEFNELPTDVYITSNDFMLLDRYRKLPEQVRKEVDNLICPITFYPEDVTASIINNRVLVRVAKKEILQNRNQTHLYQADLDEFLK